VWSEPSAPAVPFGERFLADGRWSSVIQQRTLLTLSGRWNVSDDRVCVAVEQPSVVLGGEPAYDCREISQNARTGQLMMIDRGSGERGPVILNVRPAPTDRSIE
jgi:hypothetical protein